MFKKSLFLLFIFALSSNLTPLEAQPQPTIKVKYELKDFKNPSFQKGRYGLARFSAGGKRLAVKGANETIAIYDVETGTVLQKIRADTDGASGFEFGANNQTMVLQDRFFDKISIWDLTNGKLLHKIDSLSGIANYKRVYVHSSPERRKDAGGLEAGRLPVSPDGGSLLIAKNDGAYDVVDLNNGQTRFTLRQFSKSSDARDALKMFALPFGGFFTNLYYFANASYNSNGTRVALTNGDKTPTLWDAQTGKLIARLEPNKAGVYVALFSRDGKLLATSDSAGETQIWDAETGARVSTIKGKDKNEIAAAWSPSAEVLATVSDDRNEVKLYQARTGKLTATLEKAQTRRVFFSPDGSLAAIILRNNSKQLAKIWNVADGRLLAVVPRKPNQELAFSLEWHPNGKLLALASDEYVEIYNERGEFVQNLGTAVFPARFSADGSLLVTGGRNDVGFVWQIGE